MGAKEVYQAWLDDTAHMFLEGLGDELAEYFTLPYWQKSPKTNVLVETRKEFIHGIEMFSNSLRAYGVNQFIRLVTEAVHLSDNYLEGHHVAHVLRNTTHVTPPLKARAVLRKCGNRWKAVEFETSHEHHRWPVDLLRAEEGGPAFDGFRADDVRRSRMDALSIYQTYLDQTAATVAEDDFEGYCALMDFPYRSHGAHLDQEIEGPEALRSFYEVLRRCHNGELGDRIVRTASWAEFISADQICGYHEGTAYEGDVQTIDTVHSRMLLKRTGTAWRLKSVANSIDNESYPFSMYKPGGELRTHLEIHERTKTWPTSH